MSPSHNLSFCACKTAWFAPEWQVYMGSSPHLWFFSCKTATLWPDLQVCMGPRPHLWFWACKTATLAHALVWRFWLQTSDFWTKIACLYGSQNSPVIFCMQNGVPSIRIISLYWSQPSSVVFACKTSTFGHE